MRQSKNRARETKFVYKDALARFDGTNSDGIVGLAVSMRVFQTLEREYEETRVPLNGDAAERAAFARALATACGRAKIDARETKFVYNMA